VPSEVTAGTFNFQSTGSASSVNVPIDLDGSNCGPVNGVTMCPADSALGTAGGTSRGFAADSGPFTYQTVSEYVPMPGTGCSFAPTTQQGCTIGAVADGCLFVEVGASIVSRNTSTGDLAFAKDTSASYCGNFDTPLPWSFEGQSQSTITGGTGHLANATGSYSTTFQGQILTSDPAGHGISWNRATSKGSITVP
jgi:hypothetical protein